MNPAAPTLQHSSTPALPPGRFAAGLAQMVADELMFELGGCCEPERCVVAGSLRRRKADVGDLEILYVPRFEASAVPGELLPHLRDATMPVLERWLEEGRIVKREHINGTVTWGARIKLARHVPTNLPVDFFATEMASWWNYLVCRTGPMESNVAIAKAAKERGWKWAPYSPGFYPLPGNKAEPYAVKSEREVFEFVGLPWREPWER